MDEIKLIVNIDGPRGIGKTTQIGLLSSMLNKELGVNVVANFGLLKDNDKMVERMLTSYSHLDGDTNIVINEGSFLRLLAEDLNEGVKQSDLFEANKDVIGLNEKTRFSHEALTIILQCDELDVLSNRLTQHERLTKTPVEPSDQTKEADILQRMLGFEKSMITLNTHTKVLYIHSDLKVLEVNELIKEEITSFLQSS